jgi:hypothetical protein
MKYSTIEKMVVYFGKIFFTESERKSLRLWNKISGNPRHWLTHASTQGFTHFINSRYLLCENILLSPVRVNREA